MRILFHIILAVDICRLVVAVPAAAVTTSTRLTTVTSCSCTSKSTSSGRTSTLTISGSSSCTAKKITPTCKATTSTIKTTFTPTSTSTKHTTSSSTTPKSTTTSSSTTKTTSTPKPTTTTTSSTKSTSSSSTSTSTPTPTPTKNAGHRGLAYNDPNLTLPFSLSGQFSKVSWSYNWYSFPYTIGQTQSGYNPALEFVPMLWSAASDLTSVWNANVRNAIAQYGTTAVLAFNEPDGCGGGSSCMSVSAAVSGYKTWMNPLAGTVRLGAPAVTNGASSTMGLSYLENFIGNCTGCRIDFVPIHWYGDGGDVSGFESYVGQAYIAGGSRPLWVTELGVTSGDSETFMNGVKGFLDSSSMVERWAWFMDAAGNLINANGTGLSALGQIYNSG